MQSNTLCRTVAPASPRNIRWVALCWMAGSAALTMGGCVSHQTYETARQEGRSQVNELAQTQADIKNLEQQRDDAHATNQRDERALLNLKEEIKKIQASYDQLHKSNQAKLATLQHSIAALRARHQAMLKEINDTKRNEKRLEAISAQREKSTTTTPSGPGALVIPVEGSPQEPRMVAVITPQSAQGESSTPPATLAPPASQAPSSPSAGVAPAPTAPQPAPVVAASAPQSTPAKVSHAPSAPPTPQNDSWFSGLTGWLTSLFDWLWA